MNVCLSQISISPLNLILENCTAAWVRDETRKSVQRNCCASMPMIRLTCDKLPGLTSAVAVGLLQSLTRAVRAHQKTTEVEMIQYKDILRCCRQNGHINLSVHAYYRQSPLGGGQIFAAFRGGGAPVRPPLNMRLIYNVTVQMKLNCRCCSISTAVS